jgi:hypothetical protein
LRPSRSKTATNSRTNRIIYNRLNFFFLCRLSILSIFFFFFVGFIIKLLLFYMRLFIGCFRRGGGDGEVAPGQTARVNQPDSLDSHHIASSSSFSFFFFYSLNMTET